MSRMKRPTFGSPEAWKGGSQDPRSVDPVRLAAYGILLQAEVGRRSIDRPLRIAASSFEDRDRRFLWSLVQETLRWRARLDGVIIPLLHRGIDKLDPPVRVILRMAATQVCVLDSIPSHAVVNESVRMAQRLATAGSDRLVNAVCRRLSEDGRARWSDLEDRDDPSRFWIAHSHPRWLVNRWISAWGVEQTVSMLRWDNSRPDTWLRAGPDSPAPPGEASWVPRTYRMDPAYRPLDDPGFLLGHFTVQDPSETLVGLLPPETRDGSILDLCAAPGTKTTHLAARFGGARVIAMDRSRGRMQRLRETLGRTNDRCPIVLGTGFHPPFRAGLCAGVLLDAPCSALGVLRRRVDARWNVRESDLARNRGQQIGLIDAASGLVRPGGWLLYSVCSTEPEETDQVREAFLARHRGFRPLPFEFSVPEEFLAGEGTARILPGQAGCDGVYACLFERKEART
jgi:16S rRNA (cytosine967-C5)-methyltransferase